MSHLLDRANQRLENRWQKTWVEDLFDGPPDAEAMKQAARLARLVKIRPSMHWLPADGRFSFHPANLIMVGGDPNRAAADKHFRLRKITDLETALDLSASLMARKTERNWPVGKWIDRTMTKGDTLISVDGPAGSPGGFLSYSRQLTVWVDDDGSRLDYRLNAETVYVSPEARGLQLSTILLRAAMEDVYADVEHLAEKLSSTAVRDAGLSSFTTTLSAEAHSKAGLSFLDRFRESMEEATKDAFLDSEAEALLREGTEGDYSL